MEGLGSTDTDVLVLATLSTTIVLQNRRSPVAVKIRKHLGGKCFPSRDQRGSFNGMHQDGRASRQGPVGSHPEDLENKHLARALPGPPSFAKTEWQSRALPRTKSASGRVGSWALCVGLAEQSQRNDRGRHARRSRWRRSLPREKACVTEGRHRNARAVPGDPGLPWRASCRD